MNTAKQNHQQTNGAGGSMTAAFVASGIFHGVVFLIALLGLPFVAKKPPLIVTPISVELADISDITQINRPSPPRKAEKQPEIKKPQAPKPQEKAPKVTSKAPPVITKPEAPELLPKSKPKKEPKPEKPKEKPKPKPKPKPQKPKEKPKPKPKEDQKDFESLLKNLAPDAEKNKQQEPKEVKDPQDIASEISQISRLGEKLTVSELDGIRSQIEPCWNFPIGAKNAQDLTVQLRLEINPDMSIKRASVISQGGYNQNPALKAAEESALRAVRNPRCSRLKLPAEKYEQWKVIILNFNPSSLL